MVSTIKKSRVEHKGWGFKGKRVGWAVRVDFPEQVAFFIFPFIFFPFYSPLRMNNVPLHGDTTFSSSIQQLCMDDVQKNECKRWLAGMAFKQRARCALKKKANKQRHKEIQSVSEQSACLLRQDYRAGLGRILAGITGRESPKKTPHRNQLSQFSSLMFLGFSYFM